jgi:uncharacterized OsmC-like protein
MYKATVENRGDSRHFATTRHAGFVLDTEGNGSNAIDALLASLCGCLGHYVRDYLNGRQIAHRGYSIEAKAGVTPDKARLAGINVRIDLKEVQLDHQQGAELLAFVEQCKVRTILADNPGVTITLAGQQQENGCC